MDWRFQSRFLGDEFGQLTKLLVESWCLWAVCLVWQILHHYFLVPRGAMFRVEVDEVVSLVHTPSIILGANDVLESTTTVHRSQHGSQGFAPLASVCFC